MSEPPAPSRPTPDWPNFAKITVRSFATVLVMLSGGGYWYVVLLANAMGGTDPAQINRLAIDLGWKVLVVGTAGLVAVWRLPPVLAIVVGMLAVVWAIAGLTG